ncbi:hypothetical protein OG819_22265 [Streptomyces sp. NBC_01549]|uniref:hypothetical protein n=1 Tax=Streptomyces sp. NBC_01549 TaxID=2975874 RepID=UPI00225A3AEB|nr:hypothetical protein [Streptomyces sp. NBC_01549]MCX4592356.1 hypothetical protein [Streptomyces sp. NBC_01549]
MSASTIARPTEDAAMRIYRPTPLPSAELVADRLIAARATDDRYGARHFSALLDRILEGGGGR